MSTWSSTASTARRQVFLNGAQVLNANNSFRIWRVPVKAHLHAGKNQLRVVFPSPIKAAADIAATDPWQPKTKTAAKTYLRKAAYEYGWDWGPRFVTSGIWRPVRIESWDKVRIADFAIRQRDVSREVAHLDAQVEVEASTAGPAKVTLQYSNAGKPAIVTSNVDLHPGSNVIDIPIEIRQPKLWYPAGYGDQPLYDFTAQVKRRCRILQISAKQKPACAPSSSAASSTSGAAPLNSSSTAFQFSPRAPT